jgi:hypothetical protein
MTSYKGYHFRSRLEARWAVFFDALGIPWEYEKQEYVLPSGPYLPDFWIPIPRHEHAGAGFWVEVKPEAPADPAEAREVALLAELTMATGHNGFLLAGDIGDQAIRVFKSYAIRSMRGLEYWAGRSSRPARSEPIILVVRGDGPRLNGCGEFHPEDTAACVVERDDPRGFEFPFCELCELIPKERHESGLFLRATSAARSARFEHGECSGG